MVWDPGVLRCVGDWHVDGPTLPLEFAWVSRDGRLTLVLTPGAAPVPALWCELDYLTAEASQAALAGREGTAIHAIGLWPGPVPKHSAGAAQIAQWGGDRGFDAVIWTALRPRFGGVDGAAPKDAAAAASFLGTLSGKRCYVPASMFDGRQSRSRPGSERRLRRRLRRLGAQYLMPLHRDGGPLYARGGGWYASLSC